MEVSTAYLHRYTDGNNHCRFVELWILQRVSIRRLPDDRSGVSTCRIVELSTIGDEPMGTWQVILSTDAFHVGGRCRLTAGVRF